MASVASTAPIIPGTDPNTPNSTGSFSFCSGAAPYRHRQQAEPSVCVITWPSNRDRLPMVKGLPFFTQVSLTNNFVA